MRLSRPILIAIGMLATAAAAACAVAVFRKIVFRGGDAPLTRAQLRQVESHLRDAARRRS